MKIEKFAKNLIKGIKDAERKARQNEKATDRYWNADDWGSISGIRDAEEWVENQISKYVVKRLNSFKNKN